MRLPAAAQRAGALRADCQRRRPRATACSAAALSVPLDPARPERRADRRSTTSSCRRWRAASFPTRCSSSPAARARARSRSRRRRCRSSAASTTGATSSSSTSAAPARSAPLECADAEARVARRAGRPRARRSACSTQCKAQLLKLPYISSESDLGSSRPRSRCRTSTRCGAQLGAERIDLVGASYGTRVALEYLRQFPKAVRRSVLDGVAPPDMALPASFSTRQPGGVRCAARRLRRRAGVRARRIPTCAPTWRRCCSAAAHGQRGASAERRAPRSSC